MTITTIPARMRAAFLDEPGVITTREIPVPELLPHDVLVRVEAVGVCGSDVHYYRHGSLGDFVAEDPLILGHEAAGTIVAVGSGVDEARVGNRVAIEPQRPCRACKECLAGRYNLCPNVRMYAAPPVHGAFAQFATIDADFAHPIPDHMSMEEGALVEPLSVGIYANRAGGTTVGSRVLITGAGPIGIVCAQVAIASGASSVHISDISAERRAFAVNLTGATAIEPGSASAAALEVDVLLEASGAEAALRSGIASVARAGTVVLVGVGSNDMSLPVVTIRDRELTVTGIFRYRHTWPEGIALIADGRVIVAPMVTSRHPLDDAAGALANSGQPGQIKPIVLPNA